MSKYIKNNKLNLLTAAFLSIGIVSTVHAATLSKGYTFGSTEEVTNTKLNNLVDNATISGVTSTDITNSTITADDLAPNAVTTVKITDANVTEAKLSISDNTTADVSTSAHGFVPKAPNDVLKFLRADGTWAVLTDITARVTRTTNQSISNESSTAVNFTSERYDTDTIHDNSTNNTRLTATTAGTYIISGNVLWAADATGNRQIKIVLNGSTDIGVVLQASTGAVNGNAQSLTVQYQLSATDYVELEAYQNSGGSLNILQQNNYSPEFSMTKVD